MTIASEKVKLSTERFLLVRLTPARFIAPALLSGSTYQQTFDYPIARIERNGSALTKVSSLSGNDQFTHDETTGTLQIRLASAPNDTSNVLVVYYYLFYTGTVFRSVSEDPENTATTVREWQPRLLNYPSITQSFDNIINGVFTISDTTIEIINTDHDFQDHLTDDDSFYNKAVDIWLCISSTSNIQKIFTGTITSIDTTQNIVKIDVVDSFNKLKQPAYMGDTADEAIYRRDASSFPNLNPRDNGLPSLYFVGSGSRYRTKSKAGTPSGAPTAYEIEEASQAYCINYTSDTTTANNRTWAAGRIKGSVATQAFGTLQAQLSTGTGFRFARFSSLSNVAIGDTIKWNELGTDYYGIINYVGTFTYLSVNYNVIFSDPDAPFSLSSTVSNLKSFSVIIDAPNETLTYLSPRYERDYTVSESATSGGNNALQINFVNNFEANFAGYTSLQPDNHIVSFRTSNTTVQKHGDILKEMIGKVGLSTSAATFTTANTTLPVNCRFSIPNFDEIEQDTYLKYCQDVLASTLGYLKINPSFEVEYHLLAAPSSADVRDSFLMLDGATRCKVEYQDIATKIIAYNPHADSSDIIDGANTPAATAESTKARWLHGLVNVDRFRHVLEEMTSKIDDHIALKSKRSAIYTFATATQDIDTELGDDLQLENQIVLGTGSVSDIKITSIEKSPNKTFLRASDLKGL